MTTPPARVVVLGIDAASPELLDRWIADGTLPNLAALAARGTTARTRGVEGFFVGSTWPSLYTGTTPARHGVHYLIQLQPGTYRLYESAHGPFVHGAPFWRALHATGLRQAILDVPLTRLESALHGVQVIEWGGHDALYGFRTLPETLAGELAARHGMHPQPSVCDASGRSTDDYVNFIERLEEGVRRKAAWTSELLAQGGWDLFVQVFTEAHCAGHQCWHLHDAGHPAHDPAAAARTGDPLRRVYQAIDSAVGALVAQAGAATVVVLSAHGMAHWYGAQFLLRDILVRLGAAVPLPAPPARRGARARLRRLAGALLRRLPAPVQGAARSMMHGLRPATPAAPQGASAPKIPVDVERSRCFPHANGLAVGGIRLNLAGREPHGVLQPGADADGFVAQLTAQLLAIVDDRTGEPIIRSVRRTSDLYAGERLDDLPDLLVEWSDAVPTGSTALAGGAAATVRLRSPELGELEGKNDYGRTGEHRPGGWLAVAGPGVPAARLAREVSLLDVAPTIAALLGVTLTDVDGRVIPEVVSDGHSSPAPSHVRIDRRQ
jgi:predicted AlkP superfamily phosphohydrolase/phosphomutase